MKNLMIMLSLVLLASFSFAQDAAKKGLEIAWKMDKADAGFGSFSNTLNMELSNRHGQKTSRRMMGKTLEVEGDGDKSLIVFATPPDVKGTATMSFTHRTGPDDQWLYLPAIKRVKRISSNNKSGPFMGSEFAYEDLSSQEVDKYTYKYIKDETLNGVACQILERYPVDPTSGYKRQQVWANKSNYRVEKVEFYDRKNSKLKTLSFTKYKQYKGKFWRADVMTMVNHQNGKSTTLTFTEYNFDIGLTDDDFTQNALRTAAD